MEQVFSVLCDELLVDDHAVIRRGRPTKEFVKQYVLKYDNDFYEPLSERVDIDAFAKKVSSYETLFVLFCDKRPVGLIASYFYEPTTKIGFITLVHTQNEYRGRHFAMYLLDAVKKYTESIGFNGIDLMVYQDNMSAFNLYSHNGFSVIEEENGRCKMRWINTKSFSS